MLRVIYAFNFKSSLHDTFTNMNIQNSTENKHNTLKKKKHPDETNKKCSEIEMYISTKNTIRYAQSDLCF